MGFFNQKSVRVFPPKCFSESVAKQKPGIVRKIHHLSGEHPTLRIKQRKITYMEKYNLISDVTKLQNQ